MRSHERSLPWLAISCLLVLTTTLGCQHKPQETFPVSGVVHWKNGAPATELAHSTIELQVIEGPLLRVSPHGEVQADGSFTLRTYEPKDGAPAGKYRAMIMPLLEVDIGTTTAPSVLDARFQNFNSSPLQVVVEPKPNELMLTVERAQNR